MTHAEHHPAALRRRGPLTVVIGMLAGLLVLAGCEAPEQQPEAMPDEPTEEAPAEPTPEEMAEETETIALEEVDGSGVSGEATAMHDEEAITVALELEGLPAEGEYQAHIHSGSCAEGGDVAVPLEPVLGLADGTGSSTTILEPDELDPEESYFIQVHGEGGAPIACGDVEGHGSGDSMDT